VGILDAATHFFASIHDIAKSVNVLDRRLQPALKLRLPYVFGMMSVLTPFNSNEARAIQILKKFPIRDISDSYTCECLIHVETLPSMGTEVFVIVTTHRVILVRVKKENSGVLSTNLCLEIYFSDDALYSSKVDDYGHSSVALIIYKRDLYKTVRVESKRSRILFALSPQLAWKNVTSRIGVSSGSPEEEAPNLGDTTTGSFDDYDLTGTEDGGTLVDKFTILADYQYRRQLTRLHNVISCIRGDFEAVVHDKWLSAGHQSNTDGYTSFGMYYFERHDTDVTELSEFRPMESLANLPWVGYQVFDMVGFSAEEVQTNFMAKLRETNSYTNELEVAKSEGGPEWLVEALARATFEVYEQNSASSSMQKSSSSLRRARSLRRSKTVSGVVRRVVPSIQDYNTNDCPNALAMEQNTLALYNSEQISESQTNSNPIDHNDSLHQGRIVTSSPNSPSFQSSASKTVTLHRDDMQIDTSQSRSSGSSYQSFRTAFSSPNVEGMSTTYGQSMSALDSVWIDSPPEQQEVPSQSEIINNDPVSADTTNAQNYETMNVIVNQRNENADDRVARMETLMERLLIFCSEQALQSRDPIVRVNNNNNNNDNNDNNSNNNKEEYVHLRQQQQQLLTEIAELRTMIEQQRQAETRPRTNEVNSGNNNAIVKEEIKLLRNDIAVLQSQLNMMYRSISPVREVSSPLRRNVEIVPPVDGSTEIITNLQLDNENEWSVEQID
jgi:hypothetical protein